jgi:putative ABC transport system substrate-binding protein
MRRREFIGLVGGAAVSWPMAARAQQQAMPVVGFLDVKSAKTSAHFVAAFRQGLKEAGYVEGQNIAIEFRWAEGRYDQLPALAADLVRRQAAVIAAISPNAALAAKAATTTIPIVFQSGADPVELGLVASLNRGSGNLTGIGRMYVELMPKLVELAHEAAPDAVEIAYLTNPTHPNAEALTQDVRVAARALGLQQVHVLDASTERDIDAAFAALNQPRASALVIGEDALFSNRLEQLAALALRYGVPAISSLREFAAAGGLMSYGAGLANQYRLVGVYVGRILKGEKPADLPVQQATKVELVINLKTAKALGLTFPLSILGRADEVIE